MKKTIGMFAHVDAGKTTLAEQLLFHTRTIKQRGRVDHKDTFLDNHDIEKQRGITVFAEQAMFSFHQSDYYMIDTPGHVDFSPEMERAIQLILPHLKEWGSNLLIHFSNALAKRVY